MGILYLLVYGIFVGLIAKAIHPKPNPVGLISTIGIGIAGSYVGGFLNWVFGFGTSPIETSGILGGIVGGVICLALWRWWNLKNAPDGPRSFWNGKLRDE